MTSIIVKLYKELNDLDFDRTVDLDKLQEFPSQGEATKGKFDWFIQAPKRKNHRCDKTHAEIRPRGKRIRNHFVKKRSSG